MDFPVSVTTSINDIIIEYIYFIYFRWQTGSNWKNYGGQYLEFRITGKLDTLPAKYQRYDLMWINVII